jgi:hypothetical protein
MDLAALLVAMSGYRKEDLALSPIGRAGLT